MQFAVRSYGVSQTPKLDTYPHAVLVQDNWDDYGYKTTFSVTLKIKEDQEFSLGAMKILRRDQTSGLTQLPSSVFEKLDSSYCSFGGNLDYYESLFKLGSRIYEDYLGSLQDVAL